MDESNIPLECGIEAAAVSYSKGCYIGQETINRIHSIGHVNRELHGLRLAAGLKELPAKGDRLLHSGKEAGYVTSAVMSLSLGAPVALGYVRGNSAESGRNWRCGPGAGKPSPVLRACRLQNRRNVLSNVLSPAPEVTVEWVAQATLLCRAATRGSEGRTRGDTPSSLSIQRIFPFRPAGGLCHPGSIKPTG